MGDDDEPRGITLLYTIISRPFVALFFVNRRHSDRFPGIEAEPPRGEWFKSTYFPSIYRILPTTVEGKYFNIQASIVLCKEDWPNLPFRLPKSSDNSKTKDQSASLGRTLINCLDSLLQALLGERIHTISRTQRWRLSPFLNYSEGHSFQL